VAAKLTLFVMRIGGVALPVLGVAWKVGKVKWPGAGFFDGT
jgi:hypothetical protein